MSQSDAIPPGGTRWDPDGPRGGGPLDHEAKPVSGWNDFQSGRHRFLAALSRDSASRQPPQPEAAPPAGPPAAD